MKTSIVSLIESSAISLLLSGCVFGENQQFFSSANGGGITLPLSTTPPGLGGASPAPTATPAPSAIPTPTATPSPTPENCTTNPFGTECGGTIPYVPTGQAHAFLYSLTAIPYAGAYLGTTGSVDLLTASDIIPDVQLYTNEINVPLQSYTLGFPGYPELTSWFGVCYDGALTVPTDGAYTLVTAVDDSVAIWIDGDLLMNNNDGAITSFVENNMANATAADHGTAYHPGAVAGPSVNLIAGTHTVMIKYLQAWPTQLGVQVWLYSPGQNFVANSTPSSLNLMQLTGPMNGILNCPH